MATTQEKNLNKINKAATGGQKTVPADWMPISRMRALIFEDPALLWLEFHGDDRGLWPDSTPFDFLDFYNRKSREFERRWLEEFAPQAVAVCRGSYQAYYAEKVRETIRRMLQGAAVIARPALWWEPEGIYGVPDLIAHTGWLKATFPGLISDEEAQAPAPNLGEAGKNGHYVPIDLKFTTQLIESDKKKDLMNYSAQSRLAAYMLGHMQGYMPQEAFLVARDRLTDLLPVEIQSKLGEPLDEDLQELRRRFVEIKLKGQNWTPWDDPQVASNPKNDDERWGTAKKRIAREFTPGGDLRILNRVGDSERDELARLGFPTLEALLAANPTRSKLMEAKGIGETTAARLYTILQANRSGAPIVLHPEAVPRKTPGAVHFEFYVDYEYFSNLNVDFEKQWPELEGREMVFMIGVGWEQAGEFRFEFQRAAAETPAAERALFEWFLKFLENKTGGSFTDQNQTAIYHWTKAEVWQSQRVAERQGWDEDHALLKLPWVDLQDIYVESQAGVPGAWGFGLKAVAKSLGKHDHQYDPNWVGDLDSGLGAMVLGWKVYAGDKRFKETGVNILAEYLQADCKAVWQILRWLRSVPAGEPLSAEGIPPRDWDAIKQEMAIKVEPAFVAQNVIKGKEKGVVLYLHPGAGGAEGVIPINHLIWGDRLDVLEAMGDWRKVRGRGTTGWLHHTRVSAEATLEVNFVDVGQGDGCFIVTPEGKYLLIDAGISDHMYRFLRWYFAQFKNRVTFQAGIISHPDQDHYGGFERFFSDDPAVKNLSFERLYHNGILEAGSKAKFQSGIVTEWPELQGLLDSDAKGNNYLKLLRRAWKSGRIGGIDMLWAEKSRESYLEGYGPHDLMQIRILAPVPSAPGDPLSLPWFGGQGPTKNGNSIVMHLKYRQVSMLLGGDLNTKAEDYLVAHYGSGSKVFQVQVAKSCHHGSSDFTTSFLEEIDALATVVSSGDDETYGHPRPDSLGALGRYSRADRPLIFSTELARSAPENVKHPFELEQAWLKAQDDEQEVEFVENLIQRLGRSVAVYGMITVRTDGEDILFAQKLERPAGASRKWDLHLLKFKDGEWEYAAGE